MADRERTLFPDETPMLELRGPDGKAVFRFPYQDPAAQPIEKQDGITSSALKRGALNTASSFADFGGMLAEFGGQDEMADNFYKAAEDFSLRAEKYAPTIGRVENIQSLGDAGIFAWEILLENAPMIASMVIPGGLVGKGVSLATKSATAGRAAGTTAAYLADVGIQTGESVSIAREHGASPVDLKVVGSGLGKAALDFAPLLGLASRVGIAKNVPLAQRLEKLIFGELAERGFIRRAARSSAGIMAAEIPTEVSQEVMNIALSRAFSEYEGKLTPEEKSQLLNAAAGAAAFGLLGIPAGVAKPRPGPEPEVSEEDGVPPDKGEPPQIGRSTGFTMEDDALEGEWLPPEEKIVVEPPPKGLPDPTGRLTGPVTAEYVHTEALPEMSPELEDLSSKKDTEAALEGEPEYTGQVFFVDSEGRGSMGVMPDPIQAAPQEPAGPIGRGWKLTAEQQEVAANYPQYADMDPVTPEAQNLAGLHPGLQRAYDIRDELLADEENYRTTDGQLKAAAQKKLNTINTKIQKIADALGIQPMAQPNIEATEQAVVEEKVEEATPVGLSARQKQRLQILEEKEALTGLTEREYDEYSELIDIAAGLKSGKANTRTQTKEELKEIDEVTKQVLAEDYKRVRRSQRTVDAKQEKGGIAPERAKEVLEGVARQLRFGPKVRLLDPRHPDAVRAQHEHKEGKLLGFWRFKYPGEIGIIPENISSEEQLIKTYLHETLAHYGLRTIMPNHELDSILRSIFKDPPPNLDKEHIQELLKEGKKQEAYIELEEYIASVAEEVSFNPNSGLVEQAWWKRFIAWMKQKLRKLTRVKWSDNDIVYMLRDVSKALTGRITPRNYAAPGFFIDMNGSMAKVVGKENAQQVNDDIASTFSVWGARFANWFLTPQQFSEQYNVPGSNTFLEFVQQWWARKRTLTDRPAKIAQDFMNMGPRNQQKLSKLVMEASIRSDELERRLTREEEEKLFKELGIEKDEALIKLWREMDESFQTVVSQLEHGLMIHAIRVDSKMSREQAEIVYKKYRKATTPKEKAAFLKDHSYRMHARLEEIALEMEQLSNRNYFPRSRFGNWAITIRAKKGMSYEGKFYKEGDVVFFGTYESQGAQRKAWDDLMKSHPKDSYKSQMSKIQDEDFHFLGTMSPQLYEKLKISLEGLDETQMNTLKEIYLTQSPGRSFLRHLTQRKGIAGYSEDVLRVYSAYMMNVANHIARVEYHLDMNEQLKVIRDNARATTPDARIASIVSNYFAEQFDYLMNPKNDLAQLRAMGFLWYLGFNVKSAMVNLTQVPMVAHSFLASQYGDAASAAALTRAIKDVVDLRRNGKLMSKEMREALSRAVREGFVDESRATELAGLAENPTLERLIPMTKQARLLSRTSYWGAYMFQKAERINREITFIAAYNLAKGKGLSAEAAFKEGRRAVQTAMFEYAKWNRPKFMRGNKSVLFLFWQYMQGLSYMAFGGAGAGSAMRVWLMLLMAAGLQGLPFAENIMDLVDFVGTKSKQALGLDDPRVDLREDLRELAGTLFDRPDLVMHGLSRYYGLGPLHLLQLVGLPVPNVDISGSISAGRPIPGLDSMLGSERDPSAKLGRTMVDALGPVAGIGYSFFRSVTDTNPDSWKVWERALPVALKNVSAAARRADRGGESYRGGGQVARFDWNNSEERAELIANALGFAPTKLNQRYEVDFQVNSMKQYWRIRRAMVMENLAMANMAGDPEALKDARDALSRFNDTAPDPMLRINGEQLMRSIKQRFRRASLRERGIPSELLFLRVEKALRDLYPEASVEI